MRTVYCAGDVKHEIESALGDNFLTMEEWAHTKLTPEELSVYIADELTDAKKLLFQRWREDQEITSFRSYVNDVLVS